MKKTIMALSMLLTVGLSAALAGDETNVDPRVLNTFKKEFASAENVTWRSSDNYLVATFSFNRQWISAYFNEEGALLGTARNLVFSQLPIAVMKEVTNRYDLSNVSGIFEFNEEGESSYYMQVKKEDKKFLVRVSSTGNLSGVKKIK
jgi:hypothetical protein